MGPLTVDWEPKIKKYLKTYKTYTYACTLLNINDISPMVKNYKFLIKHYISQNTYGQH